MKRIFCVALLILSASSLRAEHRLTIAVIDFQNVNKEKSLDWLGTGIAETLTTHLSRLNQITVVERTRLQSALKEIKFNRSEFVDPDTAARVGKIIGADSIVLGSYQKFEEQIRLAARLVEVETGKAVAPTSVDGSYQKIFELQDALAGNLSKEIKGTITGPSAAAPEASRPASVEAYQSFSDGVYFLRNDLLPDALAQFDKALERDPNYSEAHFYRGLALSKLKRWDEAATELKRALPRSQPVRSVKWSFDVPYEGRASDRGYILVLEDKYLGFAEHFSKEGTLHTSDQVIYTEKSGNNYILHVIDLRRRSTQRLAIAASDIPLSQMVFGNRDLLVLQAEVGQFIEPPYRLPIYLINPTDARLIARAQVEVKSRLARPWPLVRGDTLYMMYLFANMVRAIDPATGRVKWSRNDLSLLEPLGFARDKEFGDLLVVKSTDKKIHAIRTGDGTDLWTADLRTSDAYITVAENLAIALEPGRNAVAYDLRSGKLLTEVSVPPAGSWHDVGPGFRFKEVASTVQGATLYFGAEGKALCAANLSSGSKVQDRVRWKTTLGKDVNSLAANSDRVYVGTDSGELIILDAKTGSVMASNKVAKKDLVFDTLDSDILLARSGSSVFALDPTTAAKIWEFAGKSSYPEPQRFKNVVIVRSDAKQLSVLDVATGNSLWQYVGKRSPFVHMTADSLFIAEEAGVREYSVDAKPAPGLADKEVFTELAGVLVEQGKYGEAKQLLDKVTTEIDPNYPPARYLESKVLSERGDRRAAAQELVAFFEMLDPQSPRAQAALEELKKDHGLLWRTRFNADVPTEPVEIDGRIVSMGLMTGRNPQVVAVETVGGKLAWRQPGHGFVAASRSPQSGQVLYATSDESEAKRIHLYSVTVATGEARELATIETPGSGGIAQMVVGDKYAYLQITAGQAQNRKQWVLVLAFDPTSGTRLWEKTFDVDPMFRGSPVAASGEYVAFGVDKDVLILKGADGQEYARYHDDSGFHCCASMSPEGVLYLTTLDNSALAYDVRGKKLLARTKVDIDPTAKYLVARWTRDETLFDHDGHSVFAIDLHQDASSSSRVKWRVEADSDHRFERVFLGDRLMVRRDDNLAMELDPATGTVRQELGLLWDCDGMLVRGDTVFVLSAESGAYAFRMNPEAPRR